MQLNDDGCSADGYARHMAEERRVLARRNGAVYHQGTRIDNTGAIIANPLPEWDLPDNVPIDIAISRLKAMEKKRMEVVEVSYFSSVKVDLSLIS